MVYGFFFEITLSIFLNYFYIEYEKHMRSGEMSGWVKLTKEFTNDDLWFNTSAFRLYVWILLKASYRMVILLMVWN
jgi:hypothetical protein